MAVPHTAGELHQEFAIVHEQLDGLRNDIKVQTRWLVTVMVAASVLIPVMQKVLGVLP